MVSLFTNNVTSMDIACLATPLADISISFFGDFLG